MRTWHIGTPTRCSRGRKCQRSPNCPIQQAWEASTWAQPASLGNCPAQGIKYSCTADFLFVNSSSCYTFLATAHTLLSVLRSHCSLLCLTSYNRQAHPGSFCPRQPPLKRGYLFPSLSLHFVPPLKQSGILCIRKRHCGDAEGVNAASGVLHSPSGESAAHSGHLRHPSLLSQFSEDINH